ncbi:MAG: Arm DNA-binding domain-containing protein [Gammaproteobacteria bacterium]
MNTVIWSSNTVMLTDTKARQARPKEKPYKLTDHGGLYLYIAPADAKSWRYDYRLHGRRETLTPYATLGKVGTMDQVR